LSISREVKDFRETYDAISEARDRRARLAEEQRHNREMEAKNRPEDPAQHPAFLRGVQEFDQRYPKGTAASYAPPSEPVTQPSPDVGRVASTDLQPHQAAFLDAISSGESNGRFNVRYSPSGPVTFTNYQDHPRLYEPGPDGPSSAAGRYQITASTWDGLPRELRTDFSPPMQDKAAWHIAARDYSRKTGRDLDADLRQGGFTPSIASALAPTWTSLRSPDKALGVYGSRLSYYNSAGGAGAAAGASDAPIYGAASDAGGGAIPFPPTRPADLTANQTADASLDGATDGYAAGGSVRRQGGSAGAQSDALAGLEDAVRGGLGYLRQKFGVFKGQSKAIPELLDGSDDLAKFAATPGDLQRLMHAVDPHGHMHHGFRTAHALNAIYNYYAKRGRRAEADKIAAQLILYFATEADAEGAKAVQALQAGEMQKALRALETGYDYFPDSMTCTTRPAAHGGARILEYNWRTGRSKTYELSAEGLRATAQAMATGREFWPRLFSAVGLGGRA
jgi:muramidase (phage lysozyme)